METQSPYSVSPGAISEAAGAPMENRWLPALGLLLIATPLLTLLGTVMSMIFAFNQLHRTGSADPEALAGTISMSLQLTLFSFIPASVGVVLVSVALFRGWNHERWFFRNGIVLAVVYLFIAPPVSTVIGVYLLCAFSIRRKRFQVRPAL